MFLKVEEDVSLGDVSVYELSTDEDLQVVWIIELCPVTECLVNLHNSPVRLNLVQTMEITENHWKSSEVTCSKLIQG